jgi:hypothetical protein
MIARSAGDRHVPSDFGVLADHLEVSDTEVSGSVSRG